MPVTISRTVTTFFNVTVLEGTRTVERFSYNAASKNQKATAHGIMRGFEQVGRTCRVDAAPVVSRRFPSIDVWSRNRQATSHTMSGTRLGDLLTEALRCG